MKRERAFVENRRKNILDAIIENPKIRVLSTSPLSFEADVKDALGATREIRFASIQ